MYLCSTAFLSCYHFQLSPLLLALIINLLSIGVAFLSWHPSVTCSKVIPENKALIVFSRDFSVNWRDSSSRLSGTSFLPFHFSLAVSSKSGQHQQSLRLPVPSSLRTRDSWKRLLICPFASTSRLVLCSVDGYCGLLQFASLGSRTCLRNAITSEAELSQCGPLNVPCFLIHLHFFITLNFILNISQLHSSVCLYWIRFPFH